MSRPLASNVSSINGQKCVAMPSRQMLVLGKSAVGDKAEAPVFHNCYITRSHSSKEQSETTGSLKNQQGDVSS